MPGGELAGRSGTAFSVPGVPCFVSCVVVSQGPGLPSRSLCARDSVMGGNLSLKICKMCATFLGCDKHSNNNISVAVEFPSASSSDLSLMTFQEFKFLIFFEYTVIS